MIHFLQSISNNSSILICFGAQSVEIRHGLFFLVYTCLVRYVCMDGILGTLSRGNLSNTSSRVVMIFKIFIAINLLFSELGLGEGVFRRLIACFIVAESRSQHTHLYKR
jgi:hypothetical protein